jgi:hypothetical protein
MTFEHATQNQPTSPPSCCKVTLQKVERTEMRVNIMTSWGASISALIGQLLPALCSDWPSDVTGCRLRSYVLYLLWSYLGHAVPLSLIILHAYLLCMFSGLLILCIEHLCMYTRGQKTYIGLTARITRFNFSFKIGFQSLSILKRIEKSRNAITRFNSILNVTSLQLISCQRFPQD